jgi:hypothetical protein
MNIMAKGMINQLSKPRAPINENLTGCLQRSVVLGCKRKRKYLIFKTNSIVSQIILREHNFDFHHRTGEACRAKPTCSDCPSPSTSCYSNNFSFEQLDVCPRKDKYCEDKFDENLGLFFDFIDSS